MKTEKPILKVSMRKAALSQCNEGAYIRGSTIYVGACKNNESIYSINIDSITDPTGNDNVEAPTSLTFINFVRAFNRVAAKQYVRSLAPSYDIRFYR